MIVLYHVSYVDWSERKTSLIDNFVDVKNAILKTVKEELLKLWSKGSSRTVGKSDQDKEYNSLYAMS